VTRLAFQPTPQGTCIKKGKTPFISEESMMSR
jgi:hypothetical protein